MTDDERALFASIDASDGIEGEAPEAAEVERPLVLASPLPPPGPPGGGAGFVLERVIDGRDTREPVPDARQPPFPLLCRLTLDFGGRLKQGTGWLIGPSTVLTAGHCVHDPASGRWADGAVLEFGRNGPGRPLAKATATRFSALDDWRGGDVGHDLAAIHLNASSPINGAFAIRAVDLKVLNGLVVNLAGWPLPGRHAPQDADGERLYHTIESIEFGQRHADPAPGGHVRRPVRRPALARAARWGRAGRGRLARGLRRRAELGRPAERGARRDHR